MSDEKRINLTLNWETAVMLSDALAGEGDVAFSARLTDPERRAVREFVKALRRAIQGA